MGARTPKIAKIRVLQPKLRRFGPFWSKIALLWVPQQFFFFKSSGYSKMTLLGTSKVQNGVVLDFGNPKRRPFGMSSKKCI